MIDPTRLGVSVTNADGRVTRWGPDEPDARDIPGDLTFTTSIPGGFRDLSCSLLRRIDVDYPDLGLFDDIRVYGPGNRTAWEGRLNQFPRQHGAGFSIQPGAVGWVSHLRDDPSFTQAYVDRDVTGWGTASLARRLSLASTGYANDSKFSATTDGGALTWPLPTDMVTNDIAETFRTAPVGDQYTVMQYRGQRVGASWGSFEAAALYDQSGVSLGALTLDNTLRTLSFAANRGIMLRVLYTAASAAIAAGHVQTFDRLALFANHGLTRRTTSAGEPDGLYASDVIAHILTNAAPELSYTTGTDGSIEATTFAIPHLVFNDPVTAEDAILFVNGFEEYEWGVYENRLFFYRAPDPDRLTWEARLSDGAHIDLEGETADQVFNGVYVQYTEAGAGLRKTVGPPGASADATDASLEDTSDTNPVNAHGIDRRWGVLNVGSVTTQAGAIRLGSTWLGTRSLPQRRGNLRLTGTVRHPTMGEVPAWMVRAGDYVRIADHPNDVPRRIISTTYNHGSLTLQAALDNTPFNVTDLLDKWMGVSLIGTV